MEEAGVVKKTWGEVKAMVQSPLAMVRGIPKPQRKDKKDISKVKQCTTHRDS